MLRLLSGQGNSQIQYVASGIQFFSPQMYSVVLERSGLTLGASVTCKPGAESSK